jgi:hypothetical protein
MVNSFENSPEQQWSPDQRRDYERECLRETREQLPRVLASPRARRELREVRLEGTYPDTAIVVRLWDARFDKEVTQTYPIWKTPVLAGTRGIREPPNQVGMLITTWSLGG